MSMQVVTDLMMGEFMNVLRDSISMGDKNNKT